MNSTLKAHLPAWPQKISPFLLLRAVLCVSALLPACTTPGARPPLGYINSPQVMQQYHGTAARRQAIELQARGWQRSLDSLIATQGTSPNGRQIEQVARYRAALQKRVLTAGQQADQQLLQEVNAYLKEYGKAHGYDFIFGATESGNIVYANQTKDLTADVLRELNQTFDQRQKSSH